MHNLNFNNGKYSFVSAKEPPWHKLGKVLDHVFTAQEAIEHGGLNFEVEKQRMITERGIDVPAWFANVRADNRDVLGLVGNDYTIIQNREVFSFFDNIIGEGLARYETAGCLGKGGVIFVTAKLPKTIKVNGDSPVENYLVLASSHDGSMAITVYFTPVRVVCQNTLNASLMKCSNKVFLKHTQNVKERFADAATLMGIHSGYLDMLEQAFNLLHDKKVSDQDVKYIISSSMMNKEEIKKLAITGQVEFSVRKDNMVLELMNYYHSASELDSIRGNAYGVYNAVTGFFQNAKPFKSDEVKMKSLVMGGSGYQYTQKVFDMLLKY
jgi:phage/plasmid-like protein (TIGR03299 family)